MTALAYFGRDMNPVALDGRTPAMVAESLVRARGHAYVVLEPGDATRYEFHVIHAGGPCLLVMRDVGGRPSSAYLTPALNDFDLKPLTSGNEWSGQLLKWWFGLLFDAIAVDP